MTMVKIHNFGRNGNERCENTTEMTFSNHAANTKWHRTSVAFHNVFPVGSMLPLDEFQTRLKFLFDSIFGEGESSMGQNYASLSNIKKFFVYEGCVELIEE